MEGNTSNRRHHQLFRRRRCNEFYSQISNFGQIPRGKRMLAKVVFWSRRSVKLNLGEEKMLR